MLTDLPEPVASCEDCQEHLEEIPHPDDVFGTRESRERIIANYFTDYHRRRNHGQDR